MRIFKKNLIAVLSFILFCIDCHAFVKARPLYASHSVTNFFINPLTKNLKYHKIKPMFNKNSLG